MIKNVSGDGWVNITKMDDYGGINISVGAGYLLTQMAQDLKAHLDEVKRERLLRDSDPSVRLAYDAYKMAVALATSEDPAGH
jgi:hypothetical protein